jgi:VWFA-related protein
MISRALSLLLFCAVLALPAVRLHAQTAPSPDAAPQGMPGDPNGNDDTSNSVATFRQNVNLVSLYFDVRDKKNLLIPHLTRDECQVFEDKVPQTLKNFVAEVDQPLTLGILFDTSLSQKYVLPQEQQTGAAFLKRILRQKDEAFLVSFDTDINLLSDYTSNPSALERDMDKAEVSAGVSGVTTGPLPTGAPRGTLLYDAIVEASNDKLAGESGRKAIVLLTDGEDQGSRANVKDAVAAAQKANAMVYFLVAFDRRAYQQYDQYGNVYSNYFGSSAMHQISDATGGRVFDVGSNTKKMEAAFQEIEDELRTQYVASYTPINNKTDGTYRRVEIQCHQRDEALKVQSRKGYYAIAEEN